ncbi:MAG: hypothetical protein HYY95_11295 [Candidatus Rokubacteria bacterium]|nr:hypothetical protein [Candidatus Rokubacteria bacterium]MBI3106139.1 hypothetical protein [Candidatus Rokubacteria bacterium]
MRPNHAKRRAHEGRAVFGSFVFCREPAHVEILGLAGYDFVIIDTEHAALDMADVERLVIAADAAAITPIVRVAKADPQLIGRVLDLGAQGILLAHLGSREDAERIGQAVRYASAGIRGACSAVRATGYSATPFDLHVKQTAEEVWVLGLIEDAAAADAIEDILAGGYVDAVMPGPGDLSTSLGVPGQFTHPEVTKRVDRVIEAAGKASVTAAMYVSDPAEAEQWMARGARMIIYSVDAKILYQAYRRALEQMRK